MGNNEKGKPTKSEKQSSPARLDQTNIHVYPDWAAMQAYYGPRVAIPPYYNSTMASSHAPHPYMWGTPQPMMPPYGAPYAAIYPHGGVYAHPVVTLGSHSHGQGVPLSPAAVTPMSIEMPPKSGNTDRGLMKKLKEFDGLAMSIGNGAAESLEGGAEHRLSQSVETEGSSDGSDGNTAKNGVDAVVLYHNKKISMKIDSKSGQAVEFRKLPKGMPTKGLWDHPNHLHQRATAHLYHHVGIFPIYLGGHHLRGQ